MGEGVGQAEEVKICQQGEKVNIIKIVKEWLVANGYDGLAGDECGCMIDDLMPCEQICPAVCVPGKKAECKNCGSQIITPDGKDAEECEGC